MVTMHLKPKQPERYDGSRDYQIIDNWVASMDSYLAITEAEPPMVYHYLNTIFSGEAATWFRFNYSKKEPTTVTWADVRTALLAYFIKPNHTRHLRDQWAEARQIGSVTDYYTYLAQIAMQLRTISEEEFLDKFIRGLKPNTRTELEFRNPKTLDDAVKWADTFDSRYYRKTQRSYRPFASNSYQDDNRGEPMQLDVLQTTSQNTTAPIQIDAFKTKSPPTKLTKLTDEERQHLRSIGACFKCRKTGHMARECPVKTSNLGNSRRQ